MSNSEVPESVPSKDDLLQALELVGRTPNRLPVDSDDLQTLQYEHLLGVLDAAVEVLIQQRSRRTGKGNSRGHLVVKGHRYYLEHPTKTRDLMQFYQSKLERLAADMKSATNDVPA